MDGKKEMFLQTWIKHQLDCLVSLPTPPFERNERVRAYVDTHLEENSVEYPELPNAEKDAACQHYYKSLAHLCADKDELNKLAEHHQIARQLEVLGSRFRICKPDSSLKSLSLYSALAIALANSTKQETAREIKKMIRNHLKYNWKIYKRSFVHEYEDSLKSIGKKGTLDEVFDEYDWFCKTNSASALELFAAAKLFKFDYCLIIAYQDIYFFVINCNDKQVKKDALIKLYILRTGDGPVNYTYQVLAPIDDFLPPQNGTYPLKIRNVLELNDPVKEKDKIKGKLRKFFEVAASTSHSSSVVKGKPSSINHDKIILITGRYKQMEFAYKELGVSPFTLFSILAEQFYSSCVSGYDVKEYLDQQWGDEEKHYASPLMEYPGDVKYLKLASKFYRFNYAVLKLSPKNGICFEEMSPSTEGEEGYIPGTEDRPWYYFLIKTSNSSEITWHALHCFSSIQPVLEEIIHLKEQQQNGDYKNHLSWMTDKFIDRLLRCGILKSEDYMKQRTDYIKSIAHAFDPKKLSSHCLVLKEGQLSFGGYPSEISLKDGTMPFVEHGATEDGTPYDILPGSEESSHDYLDKSGVGVCLPYLILDKTKHASWKPASKSKSATRVAALDW